MREFPNVILFIAIFIIYAVRIIYALFKIARAKDGEKFLSSLGKQDKSNKDYQIKEEENVIIKEEKRKKQLQKAEQNRLRELEKIKREVDIQKRIAENEAAGIACCPKCGSSSIQYMTKEKNRTGTGILLSIADPITGIIVGSSSKSSTYIKCLYCGHEFRR